MIEDYLTAGRYREAFELLNDISDEKTRYYRIVCLYGMQELRQARQEAKVALEIAEETYYDVVAIYLTILRDLQEYEEAIDMVIKELSMPYIPYQYESLFNEAYDQLLLDKQEANQYEQRFVSVFSEEELEQVLLKNSREDALYMAIDQMEGMNIRYLLSSIRTFLLDEKKPNLAKSMLIEILVDQEVDEEMTVIKGGRRIEFNPIYLSKVNDTEQILEIANLLSDHIEDDNPSLYELTLEFLCMYMYDLYPRYVEENPNVVAAAIHYYIATLQYLDEDIEDICFDYFVEEQDLLEKIEDLKGIEV